MSTKNPFNINDDENKFLAWQEGYNSPLTDEDCPFSDINDPELFAVWQKGFNSNKNRMTVIKGPKVAPTPKIDQKAVSVLPMPSPAVDLSAYSTEVILAEATKRIQAGEEVLAKAKKLLG